VASAKTGALFLGNGVNKRAASVQSSDAMMAEEQSLPHDLANLQKTVTSGLSFEYLFFWGHRHKNPAYLDKSCFSQWYPAPFYLDGESYPCAEHFMMAEKARLFSDGETLKKMLSTSNPSEAKKLGRQIKGFIESIWQENCFNIVVRGNLAKLSQNEEFKRFLLQTKKKILAEQAQ
jgi:ribA/ribD-fused uncharacterized protein